MSTKLSAFTSQKFKFWSFISMVLLVFVHGYCLNDRYMQPWTVVDEPLGVNTFLQYFLANGISRFRIPMLFLISGYLYAMHDEKPYGERTKKRFRSLFVPYLIWSLIGLAFTYLFELTALGKSVIASTHFMQVDEHRMFLHDYTWYEWLGRWILVPVPFQLWFLRVLFFYNIIYPFLRWCVTRGWGKWIFFGLAILLWLSTGGLFLFEGEGLLFFSLGIWMQKNKFNIETPNNWLRPGFWSIVFVTAAAIKSWLAFKGQDFIGESSFLLMTILHKLVIFSGLITAWFGGNQLVKWCMQRQWFIWLSAFSFFIYAMHVPLITYAIDVVYGYINHIPHYRLLTFIFLPLSIILLSIGCGVVIRKLFPTCYSLLTGGRGI